MNKKDNVLNEKINQRFKTDFNQQISGESFSKVSLVALVSADMQRILKIPLNDTTKQAAISELLQILIDNL